MDNKEYKHFIVGDKLAETIESLTGDASKKYKHRDFVKPLIDYCVDGCYNGKVGIVYGLRSTGKTVGMLQVAESLTERGLNVAYAHFNYEETGMKTVTEEIQSLASRGITHFFLDEASYLGGFINLAPDWSDWLVPAHKIKIIISGTDSFMLWTAQTTSLFHRFVQFSTNWNSFPEYKRVIGKSYDDFKKEGGIFTEEDASTFIQHAVVDNLLHTIENCMDEAHRRTLYTDRLYGLSPAVVYKAVISIFKCAAEDAIYEHFTEKSDQKNIVDLGTAVSGLPPKDRRDIKERVAESISVYRNFTPVKDPLNVIEALTEFLVKVGCLNKYSTASHEFGELNAYMFTHNSLMNYSVEETVRGILNLNNADQPELVKGIRQAAEGALNENIVFAHVFREANEKKGSKVFKYHDVNNREIDAVIINHTTKELRLIEVKSKSKIDINRVFKNEAKHLYDDEVLKNIGVDDGYAISRIVAYQGESKAIPHTNGDLVLSNIEEFLCNLKDLQIYLNKFQSISQLEY
jgi:predicted AAA+ superfamily ATPase